MSVQQFPYPRKEPEQMAAVLDRAERLGLVFDDRLSLWMDLESSRVDLDRLAQFDDFNFTHDVAGIQNHMDRSSYPGKLTDCFLPHAGVVE